ncbi:hypothetical protein LFM09_11685 [Lentzea alba]|uniref:hypothetical protein n=1 Tax=Lentzea alba TaxID=2714351 RepID=UPI0039BFFC30
MGRALGALAVLLLLLLCTACGQVKQPKGDGVYPIDTAAPQLTVPTSVPPTGPCTVQEEVRPPATETVAAAPTGGATPDVAPHQAENNRWKQRKPLSAQGVQSGRDVLAKIRPELERICGSGDFSVDATKKALAAFKPLVEQAASYATGVSFTITVENGPTERTTCVFGSLQPGAVWVSVDGTNGEGSCYTPKTH